MNSSFLHLSIQTSMELRCASFIFFNMTRIVRYLIILRWINRKWKKSAKANVTQSLSAVYRSLSLPTKWGCNNEPKCSFWLSVLPDLYLIRGNQMDLTAKRSDKEMSGNSKTANRGVFIWCHGLALCNSEALGNVAPFSIWLTKTLTFNEPETKQHWKWYEYLMQGQAAIFYVQQFIRMFHGCQIWIITKNKQILITNKNRKSLLRYGRKLCAEGFDYVCAIAIALAVEPD